MKKWILASLCIVTPLSAAYGERIRDFSMPLNQSLNQPSNTHSKPVMINNNNNYQQPQQEQDPIENPGNNYMPTPPEPPSNHFMDNYCDPNFKVGGIAQTSITECLGEKRQQACQEYIALPVDARKVMNLAIDCQYSSSENRGSDSEEGQQPISISLPQGCETTSELRLKLLKKYYNDNYVSHALLFLPETALNGGAQCVMGR